MSSPHSHQPQQQPVLSSVDIRTSACGDGTAAASVVHVTNANELRALGADPDSSSCHLCVTVDLPATPDTELQGPHPISLAAHPHGAALCSGAQAIGRSFRCLVTVRIEPTSSVSPSESSSSSSGSGDTVMLRAPPSSIFHGIAETRHRLAQARRVTPTPLARVMLHSIPPETFDKAERRKGTISAAFLQHVREAIVTPGDILRIDADCLVMVAECSPVAQGVVTPATVIALAPAPTSTFAACPWPLDVYGPAPLPMCETCYIIAAATKPPPAAPLAIPGLPSSLLSTIRPSVPSLRACALLQPLTYAPPIEHAQRDVQIELGLTIAALRRIGIPAGSLIQVTRTLR